MCLCTFQKEPIIAEKDIIVGKGLIKEKGKYYTPFQLFPAELNSLIEGNTEIEFERYMQEGFEIGEGFIHSYTDFYKVFEEDVFKAIIPKGTPFYINWMGDEIASKKLYITSEKYTPSTFIYKDGLRIGDILSNNNLIHIEDYNGEKVDAVFAGICNNKPLYVKPFLTKEKPDYEQAKVVNSNLGFINYTLEKSNTGTIIPWENDITLYHMKICNL